MPADPHTPDRPLSDHLRRLVWLCLFVPAVAIVVLATEIIAMLASERQAQANDLAASMAARVDASLQAQIRSLQSLSASAPQPGETLFQRQWHTRLLAYDQRFNAPTFLASHSQQMLVHSRHALGQDLPRVPVPAGRSAFDEAMKSLKPAIGDWVMGPVLQQPVVAAAVPWTDALPDPLAVMSAIPVTQLEGEFQTFSTPTGLSVRLLDSTQKILAQSHGGTSHGLPHTWQPILTTVSLGVVPWTVQVQVHSASYYTPFMALIAWLVAGVLVTL